jgi:hypothetical protein
MALLAPITISDGKATPVARKFDPLLRNGNTVELAEMTSGGSLEARPVLRIIQKPVGQGGRSTQEVQLELAIPNAVTETVNGVSRTVIVDYDRFVIRHVAGKSSTEQRRKDVRVLAANLLQNALISTVLDKAETITG